ncbi:MAG: ribosome-associated translation inhibitor RaiA [Chitinispirillales bacterium]|nr:ribosome-associated translation inhibitor RaiA [Chitinispirillales bacterium]
MKVQITARHERKISDETKIFVEEEVENLVKFYDKITSAQVILDKQTYKNGSEDIVEIIVNVDKSQLVGKSSAENMRKAFDDAKEKVIRQLKKHDDIKKSHNCEPLKEAVVKI